MKPTSVWGRVSFGGALRPAFQSLLFSDESAKEMLAHYKYKCHKPRTNVPWRGCVRWLCHISSKGFVWLPTVTSSNKLQISSSKKKVMRDRRQRWGNETVNFVSRRFLHEKSSRFVLKFRLDSVLWGIFDKGSNRNILSSSANKLPLTKWESDEIEKDSKGRQAK